MNTSRVPKIDLLLNPFPDLRLEQAPPLASQSGYARWLNFSADGAKRFLVPEDRHRHWLACQTLSLGVRSLLFTHWDHDHGFLSTPRESKLSPPELAQELLGPEHFASLVGEDSLLGFSDTLSPAALEQKAESLRQVIISREPIHLWPNRHLEALTAFTNSDFGGSGVGLQTHYQKLSDSAPARAEEVVARLDQHFLRRFQEGVPSHSFGLGWDGLKACTQDALSRYRQELPDLLLQRTQLLSRIDEAHRQFAAVGPFAQRLDARRGSGTSFDLFRECVHLHLAFFQVELRLRALAYASDFYLPRFLRELEAQATSWASFSAQLQALHDWALAQINSCEQANRDPDYRANIVDIILPAQISRSFISLSMDVAGLSSADALCRQTLVAHTKAQRLSAFATFTEATLRDLLLPLCVDHGVRRHHALLKDKPDLCPVVGSNIYVELRRVGGGAITPALRDLLRLGLSTASAFLARQTNAQPMLIEAAMGQPPAPAERILLLLPEIDGEAAFKSELISTLTHATPLPTDFRPSQGPDAHLEVVAISQVHYFPLRFTQAVAALQQQHPIDSIPWHAWSFPHEPGTLPSLFLQNDQQRRQNALSYLMLLSALGRLRIGGDEGDESLEIFQPNSRSPEISDWEIPLGIRTD